MSEVPRCPRCEAQLLVEGEYGSCPNCGWRSALQTVPHSTTPGDGSGTAHRAIRIPCPHCGNRIPLPEPYPAEITCTSCGSAFHVEPGSTIDIRQHLPKAIGKFQVQELLGRGGFGAVYRAHDPELDRTVAIKVPRAGSLTSQEEEERFLREARSAARLKHPGIVSVHEIGEESGLPYIVSDYIDGLTLADVITGGRLTFRESAELVAQIADALDFAHHQKIVHRDIKPGNILVDDAGRPHIGDFGLARREEGEITVTLDGQILGTPAYMAPEQASGELHKVTAQSDLYSLGVVLYELLTGELPFRGNRRMLIHQVLHDEPRPPRRLNDRIPRDLETICLKAMAKEPARRYASARDLADDLRRYLNGEPIQARPITMVERAWRWSRRRPAVASLMAALFLVITASLAGLATLWQQAEKRRQDAESAQAAESRAKALAQQHLARAKWNLYLSKIRLARQELQEGHVTRAQELLESMKPAGDEPDLRCFEWNYLSCLCRLAPPTLDAGDGAAGIAYSPDGRWLAVAGSQDSHRVYVWDAARGQRRWTLVDPTMIPWSVSFSRDSRYLASGGYDTKVHLWDMQTGKQAASWEAPRQPLAIAFSPVEDQLAVGEFGRATLRNAVTGKEIAALPIPTVSVPRVHGLSYSRNGQLLAAALNGWIVIWDVPTRKIFRTVQASQMDPPALSPDGRLLAYGLTPDDIAVHNLLTHQTLILRGPGPAGFSMVWSPDGSRLATTTQDGVIHIWDVARQHEELALPGHGDMFQRLAFRPDGLRLVSTSIDGPIRFWRLSGAEAVEHRLGPVQVQTPDSRRTFTGYATQAPKAWDAVSGKELFTFESVPGKVLQLVCSPDGTVLAGLESKPGNDWAVVLWETSSGRLLHTLPTGQGSANGQLSFSPDGKLLAIATSATLQSCTFDCSPVTTLVWVVNAA